MSRNTGSRAFQNARLRKQQKKAAEGSAEALILEQCGFGPDAQTSATSQTAASGLLAQAAMLNDSGRYAEAQAICREILQKEPNNFDVLHLLGTSEFRSGQHEEAERHLKHALSVHPLSAATYSNLGLTLGALKRFKEALACFDNAIAIKPDCVEAFNNGGNLLVGLNRLEQALACYDTALAVKPDDADAHSNRANVMIELRQYEEAAASCDRALAINPDHVPALNNRGQALNHLKRLDDALGSFDRAIALDPSYTSAWLGRGNALRLMKRPEEAFAAYTEALRIQPNHYKSLTEIAWWYQRQGDVEKVISFYDKALAIKPDYPVALENKIYMLDYAPNVGFAEAQASRKHWWAQIGSKFSSDAVPHHDNDPEPTRRLVLGYVSADFRGHSAARVFRPVLQNHDKTRFEVVCYSCSLFEDDVTEDFKRIADKWRNTSRFSDPQLVNQVLADKVDVLIDLSGHTAGHRLVMFAHKPAPVQVTAWGNAGGTGLPTIDYLFSDPVTIPNDVRHFFTEKIYDLPCALTTEAPPEHIRPSDPPVLTNKYVTFGFFNRTSKISDDAVKVWSHILNTAQGSRLLIKHFEVEEESIQRMLRDKFAAHGVSADRIDFLGSSNREEHLIAYSRVDICFDPFPQNGGVSTWETLHMGVPVVALLGNSLSTRVAGAILSSVGMSDWVANSADEYAAIALKYASDPDYLKKLRHELPSKISMSAAGNPVLYTRAVETAYRTMWEEYCKRQTDRDALRQA